MTFVNEIYPYETTKHVMQCTGVVLKAHMTGKCADKNIVSKITENGKSDDCSPPWSLPRKM
jgi:hypothetical protein